MRKVTMVIMIVSLAFGLCGCATKHLTIEQSKKNFAVYEKSLQEIADKYGLKLTSTEDKNIENQDSYKDFLITISSNVDIEIRIINSAYEAEKGVEGFNVNYKISVVDTEGDFNMPLFVDLVNCVSGKNISVDYCNEFLNAPESKYSAEKYGYKKLNGEIIAKQHALNFFEDWNISYILSKDGEGILSFGGLTKQISG